MGPFFRDVAMRQTPPAPDVLQSLLARVERLYYIGDVSVLHVLEHGIEGAEKLAGLKARSPSGGEPRAPAHRRGRAAR